MRRQHKTCRERNCEEPPYLGGLCEKHHEEDSLRKRRKEAAIQCLHVGVVDGRLPENPELREELSRLRKWWNRACQAVQSRHDATHMPLDEADYALDWCIALAQAIMDAELAFRSGERIPDSLAATRHWVWDRFNNLEAGLRSNGTPRKDTD